MARLPKSLGHRKSAERGLAGPWVLRLLVSLIGAGLFAVAFPLVHALWTDHLPPIVSYLAAKVPGLHLIVAGKDIDSVVLSSPLREWIIAGFVFGFMWEWARKFLNEHVFPRPDRKVLIPLPDPLPFDPLWGSGLSVEIDKDEIPFGWIPPSRGARYDAWRQLCHFANNNSSDGHFTFWKRPSGEFHDFRWTVLTGRPGAGKTRMAVEFLRCELARWADLQGPKRLTWSVRKKILWGEWWRRLWAMRRVGDPWDIGWIMPNWGNLGRQHATRKNLDRAYKGLLKEWRPRRPTAFLLDDPMEDDLAEIIGLLEEQARHYRFSVRLLIVSQSLPRELKLEPANDPGGWKSPINSYYGRLVVLTNEAFLSKEEIGSLASDWVSAMRDRRQTTPEVSQNLDTLVSITEGNPLLVELALRSMARGIAVEHLKAHDLVADRAGRILESLALAHPFLDDGVFCALASATLAGPVKSEPWSKFTTEPVFNAAVHKYREPLRRCFNFNRPGAVGALPAVRPELVGDAFVQLVLAKHCESSETQDEIAAVAWHLNSRGVLRTIERTAAGSDELARIMRVSPPQEVGVEGSDLAFSYAAAAIRVHFHRDQPPDRALGIMRLACQRIVELPSDIAAELLWRLISVIESDSPIKKDRDQASYVCFFTAANRALDGGQIANDDQLAERAVKAANRLWNPWSDVTVWADVPEVKYAFAGVEAIAIRAESIAEPRSLALEEHAARSWFRTALVKDAMGDAAGLKLTARRVCEISDRLPEDEVIAEAAIETWICVAQFLARIGDSSGCEIAIEAAKAIAGRFPDSPIFDGKRMHALETLGFFRTWMVDLPGTESVALEVQGFADRLADRPLAASSTARAWLNVASVAARVGNAAKCRQAVKLVEGIANDSRESDVLESLRAKARYNLCILEANLGNQAACKEAAEGVESVATAVPDDLDLLATLANAWVEVSRAAISSNDYSTCDAAVLKLIRITEPFRGLWEFDRAAANGFINLCKARALSGDVAACAVLEQRVSGIVNRHPRSEIFEEVRAKAIYSVAISHFVVGEASACELAKNRLEEIAGPYIRAENFGFLVVAAWQLVAIAKKNAGDDVDADIALARLEEVAAGFPASTRITQLCGGTRSALRPEGRSSPSMTQPQS